jgi:hypothetical protein
MSPFTARRGAGIDRSGPSRHVRDHRPGDPLQRSSTPPLGSRWDAVQAAAQVWSRDHWTRVLTGGRGLRLTRHVADPGCSRLRPPLSRRVVVSSACLDAVHRAGGEGDACAPGCGQHQRPAVRREWQRRRRQSSGALVSPSRRASWMTSGNRPQEVCARVDDDSPRGPRGMRFAWARLGRSESRRPR